MQGSVGVHSYSLHDLVKSLHLRVCNARPPPQGEKNICGFLLAEISKKKKIKIKGVPFDHIDHI
jgi:hypothetical protein